MNNSIQNVGSGFNLDTYLKARKTTISIVSQVASEMKVGMNFQDGLDLIKAISHSKGITKFWHPSKFRIGPDTLNVFREKSDPDIRLKSDDLFFIDIGPVIHGHEADYGQTFSLTLSPHEKLKLAAKSIFDAAKDKWKSEKLTGKELYQFAEEESKKRSFELNLGMTGHRLGDFPHAVFYKGNLSSFEKEPIPNLWVLEILIKDPSKNRGAFFEDIIF